MYDVWLKNMIVEKDDKVMKMLNLIKDNAKAGRQVYLMCWCAPKRCHAESIREQVEKMIEEDR